jgi:hypothetical protein
MAVAGGKMYTLLLYIPLTLMVLTRPNEGRIPAWLERRIARWPSWLRGMSPPKEAATDARELLGHGADVGSP